MIFEQISVKGLGYLGNSYVLVDGKIYFCQTNGYEASLYDANGFRYGKAKRTVDDNNCKDVNFLSPVLGYVNHPAFKHGQYLRRTPLRAWRVGLTRNNITPKSFIERYEANQVIEALQRIHDREYPSFEEAQRESQNSRVEVAFHRKYAVHGSRLFYCGRHIGEVLPDEVHVFSIDESFHSGNIESLLERPIVRRETNRPNYGNEDI